MVHRPKISLVGGGNIGGTLAHLAGLKQLGEVFLFDIQKGVAQGKALDLASSMAEESSGIAYSGGNSWEELHGSDVVIVTAGIPRGPGMSRDDLVHTNARIIADVAQMIRIHASDSFVIVITNPLDAMVSLMQKETGFHHQKVVGMAGVLDSSRFRYFLSQKLRVALSDVHALVLGGHGDTMVPMIRYCSVSGIPLLSLVEQGWITSSELDDVIERTRNGGAEIIKLLERSSAYYAPASSALAMATSYLRHERRILPCAAYLDGEYGVRGLYVGVPVIMGANGVEQIVELPLTNAEQSMFDHSVASVRSLTDKVEEFRLSMTK